MLEAYRKTREKELETDISHSQWYRWNERYIKTYKQILGGRFSSKILDLGCGADYFSKTCRLQEYEAEGVDIDTIDFERDDLPYPDATFQVVHFNAVLEHIANPDTILKEIKRILKPGGVVIINVPNWQIDYKNFYNDPTHKKPYTPKSLRWLCQMYGFKVIFLEPALICHPLANFNWRLPNFLKWRMSSLVKGGSKSILAVAEKI